MTAPSNPDCDDSIDELDDEPVAGSALTPYVDDLALTPTAADASAWSDECLSGAVEWCISQFAAAEADVSSGDLSGLGRLSGARAPRLGGVLNGRLAPGSAAADTLTLGVEQTLRAGYQVAVAARQVADVPVRRLTADQLWAAFVPASYRIPRSVSTTAWELCPFERYWVSLLDDLGLEREARRLDLGRVSPLSRSIRGLSTVGVALAISERGGRRQRSTLERQPRRPRYRPARAVPVASRPLVADEPARAPEGGYAQTVK